MEDQSIIVACLACGHWRETERTQNGLQVAECPACGYLGWIKVEAAAVAARSRRR